MTTVLSCRDLRVCAGSRTLVDRLDLALQAGELTALLGRNGTGKTTLLHTLAGLREPAAGKVLLEGEPLGSFSRRHVARRLGLLMQRHEDPFPTTALEMALIGRHPHIDFWRWESAADQATARAALASVDLEGMGERAIDTLSGGERRRVAIATLLTQRPGIYLLDEPLNHLDPHHQIQVMDRFRALANEGAAVLAALHDVNIAARYCDSALLLLGGDGGGEWLAGPAVSTLTSANLSRLYGTRIEEITWGRRAVFVQT